MTILEDIHGIYGGLLFLLCIAVIAPFRWLGFGLAWTGRQLASGSETIAQWLESRLIR